MGNDLIAETEKRTNMTTRLGRVLERGDKLAVFANVAPRPREALAP
jgi:hypothetical protein